MPSGRSSIGDPAPGRRAKCSSTFAVFEWTGAQLVADVEQISHLAQAAGDPRSRHVQLRVEPAIRAKI
jgi:hypothetical protein